MVDILSILLVLLIGGGFLCGAALIPFAAIRERGRRRWAIVVGSVLLIAGALGFFGSALSALGGLNWLPASFEWPVGYATGVVTTGEGLRVVPHAPSGRVQVYDADWRFLRGWPVAAYGGTFKLSANERGQINVFTARGKRHYVFGTDGEPISQSSYWPASYESLASRGESVLVPTSLWLWTFTHPAIGWAVAATGLATLILIARTGRSRNRHRLDC